MATPLSTAILAVSLLLGLWAAAAAAVDRLPGTPYLKALFVLQALLFGQLVYVLYRVSGGDRPAEKGAFAGYVVVSLLLVPGGLAWSVDERSRWGTAVLVLTCLTTALVQVRLVATW